LAEREVGLSGSRIDESEAVVAFRGELYADALIYIFIRKKNRKKKKTIIQNALEQRGSKMQLDE